MAFTSEDLRAMEERVALGKSKKLRLPLVQVATEPLPEIRTNFVIQPTTDEAKLNKLERAWLRVLESRRYPWMAVQSIALKLGDDTRYVPDFEAIGPNGEMLFFETKGFYRPQARVKVQTAARLFRWAKFYLVRREKKTMAWTEEEVKP